MFNSNARSFSSVNIKEKWLKLPKSQPAMNDYFKSCNILMRYMRTLDETLLNELILSSQTVPVGRDDDLIDFRSFTQICDHTHQLGPNKPNDMNERIAPYAHAVFNDIFNFNQRTEYVDLETSRPVTSALRAITESLKPAYIVYNNDIGSTVPIKYSGGSNTIYKALDGGYAPFRHPLVLPVDAIYNYDMLNGDDMMGQPHGANLGVYMVMGPGDELLTGRNIGKYSGHTEVSSLGNYTTGVRKMENLAGQHDEKMYDQKLSVCFYITREKETSYGIADELIDVCKTNSKSRVLEKQYKELAVIKLGSIIYNGTPFQTHFEGGSESVLLEHFNFNSANQWEVFPFYYNENEFHEYPLFEFPLNHPIGIEQVTDRAIIQKEMAGVFDKLIEEEEKAEERVEVVKRKRKMEQDAERDRIKQRKRGVGAVPNQPPRQVPAPNLPIRQVADVPGPEAFNLQPKAKKSTKTEDVDQTIPMELNVGPTFQSVEEITRAAEEKKQRTGKTKPYDRQTKKGGQKTRLDEV
uniref:ORF74 n=1 Tax=Malaco herpesvirus 1 TaxID=3031797 RepID=A0AA48P7T6_9VIRU|nr:TPA_asm: ORF74 [Malaco herpesvirus 1]